MKKIAMITAGLFVLAIALAVPMLAGEDEQRINLADCPDAVQKAIKSVAGNGTITEIEKEVENGKTIYEVEFKDGNGKENEIAIAEDGRIVAADDDDADDEEDADTEQK